MSQKKDEIVTANATECLFDTNAITRTSTKMHRVQWTIEDFSHLPLDTEIPGPDFYLTKTCLCNISFRKCSEALYVYFHNKSGASIKIIRSLLLFDRNGTELHQDKMENSYVVESNGEVDIITSVKSRGFDSLKDDILIIDCRLKLERAVTTTETSFFKLRRELRENLIKDLEAMFNNPVHSDFNIKVGNKLIYSHKSLLCARSAYFKRMIETEMKESEENSVVVTDVSHPTMQKLVLFLYTAGFTETFEDNNISQFYDLYLASDKYEVMDLRALCADKLLSIATAGNIFQILKLAQRHNDEDLKIKAMKFISFHYDEMDKANAWKTLISSERELASEVLSFCYKQFKTIP